MSENSFLQVLVVITDGQQTGSANLSDIADKLKKKGVVIISVGIGMAVDPAELVVIAQGVSSNVIQIGDFTELKNRTEALIELSCRGKHAEFLF